MLNRVCKPLLSETKDLKLLLCTHTLCLKNLCASSNILLAAPGADTDQRSGEASRPLSALELPGPDEWSRYQYTCNVTGLTPNSTRQVSLILKMGRWFFKKVIFKKSDYRTKVYVKQYQLLSITMKYESCSFRNRVLRHIKWQTSFFKLALWVKKSYVRKLDQNDKQNTFIYLPSCPKSHEITESEKS